MLKIDQKHLLQLLESSPDIVIGVDRRGTIIYYNDGARKILRYEPGEIIGQPVTVLYGSLGEAQRVIRAMRESRDLGRISNFETVFRSKSSEEIPVAVSGSLIFDDLGQEIGSIGFARDTRPMRRREQLATLGEIAVSLAHEVNNPLESITNNLELLARDLMSKLSQAEQVVEAERIDSIRASLERVQAIVRRVDEMARKGTYATRDYMAGKRMADLAPPGPSAAPSAPFPPAHPQSAIRDQRPLAGMSVLVVDDDLSVLSSLADLLRAEGCIVQTAARPSVALGILRNLKIDAVLSDVVMPEMDGYEFYTKISEELPDLPVILMTAFYYDKDHIIQRSRLRGVEGAIFKKPVNPDRLRQLLAQVRQKSQAHGALRP